MNTRSLMGLPDQQPPTPTLYDQLWHKLDGAYARWRRYRKHGAEECAKHGVNLDQMQGRVLGLVDALTIMSKGKLDGEAAVKAECLRRWKERQGLDKSQPPADA